MPGPSFEVNSIGVIDLWLAWYKSNYPTAFFVPSFGFSLIQDTVQYQRFIHEMETVYGASFTSPMSIVFDNSAEYTAFQLTYG